MLNSSDNKNIKSSSKTVVLTAQKLNDLHQLCLGFAESRTPDSYSLLAIINDLVQLYAKLAIEQSQKFGNSQRKRINRKMEEAKNHRSFRDLKMTLSESDKEAYMSVQTQLEEETQALEEYELYVALMYSVKEAIRFGISVNTSVRNQELNEKFNQ